MCVYVSDTCNDYSLLNIFYYIFPIFLTIQCQMDFWNGIHAFFSFRFVSVCLFVCVSSGTYFGIRYCYNNSTQTEKRNGKKTFFFASFFYKMFFFLIQSIFFIWATSTSYRYFLLLALFSLHCNICDYTYYVSLGWSKKMCNAGIYCSYIKKYLSEVRNVKTYKIKKKEKLRSDERKTNE